MTHIGQSTTWSFDPSSFVVSHSDIFELTLRGISICTVEEIVILLNFLCLVYLCVCIVLHRTLKT